MSSDKPNDEIQREMGKLTDTPDLESLLSVALKSICLTRDYVDKDLLPVIEGWEWYDAGIKISEAIPNNGWSEQFRLRIADPKSRLEVEE